jgi:hypothetical protein
MKLHRAALYILFITLFCLITAGSSGAWVKDPPDPQPDVDKSTPDMSCWLATAANMLSGAGYGNGGAGGPQERAELIYSQLKDHFGGDD